MSSIGRRSGTSQIALVLEAISIINRYCRRIAAMLHPFWLASKQTLLGVVFLFGVMLLCAALLSPVAMCALVNFGY
jgi:hypothetical protein